MPHEIHSLRSYSASKAKWWSQEHVAHFPDSIPQSATLKKFTYFPGFLQAAHYIQLRLALPHDEILKLYDEFSRKSKNSFFSVNMRHLAPSFTTGGDRGEFPKEYEIFILDDPDADGFHPNRYHGVAISKSRDEIVYWAILRE
jgi:hypothetical protein